MTARSATAFAPATVANVGVGFDLLGFAVDALGDRVTVAMGSPGVRITEIFGPGSDVIPREPRENSATVGLIALLEELRLPFGFDVSIRKGIPLGSGLGGSAASAVGAIVAANELLVDKLSIEDQLSYALLGEAAASGAPHPDNAAPSLYGGFTFARASHDGVKTDVVRLPFFEDARVVLVHPHARIDTRRAREVLPESYSLGSIVEQTSNLSSLFIGMYEKDWKRVSEAIKDVLVEPHRSQLVPGFYEAKRAAAGAGCRAFSLSGSGPTVFAICRDHDEAAAVSRAICTALRDESIEFDEYLSVVGTRGAYVIEETE